MYTILLPLFGLVTLGSAALTYPVFGTKRYTRANLLPASEYGGSRSVPVYPHVPQYYDSQPQYMTMPLYSMNPSTSSDYYDDSTSYNSNYYYVPPVHRRHQRQERYPSYGLPTYRGEYKPTPYYYAHAPSYSYSDDRESNNPLDDLHEEMLQEDERERARDYIPVGQEQWYESPSRSSSDSDFLRNLIMYNKQMNALRNNQPDSQEEYDEYDNVEPEYYDTPYADQRNSYNTFVNPYTSNTNSNSRSTLSKINSLRNSMAKNAVEDDEEVQELKSLIHQQKNSRTPQLQQQQLLQPQIAQQPFEIPTPAPIKDIKQQQQRSLTNDYQQYGSTDNWQRDSPSYSNYEYENDYDDSWSHWDRKRNVQPKKVAITLPFSSTTPAITTTTTTTTTTSSPKPQSAIVDNEHSGQKEIAIPRPASPARNPFANLGGLPRAQPAQAVAVNMVAQAKPARAKSGSVYDTIKKIINMQQNLEDADLAQQLDSQKHRDPRVQKRFVTNEESLVQQLDGLKRTA
ncbi:basic-leucine zipper transcription factor A-like [Topomyia yanbarensis]|uniref:basic-leucine zipper transcription factor A-like n=1 Tax=Topomyia yanbarensis TaxID=2498891 RepID=UPI00273BCB7D|nr:basic-leucine zipper transcription factor A-like [Topomyia yanbarensis]XP_058818678.1 basic-leucine zipper transcription factor A-like [Topomyia yanbarensis]